MYPVSGGTARFPHYAFGGVAGASFGWFSWLQAATVAPIEVSAMITYAPALLLRATAGSTRRPSVLTTQRHHRRGLPDGAADRDQLPRDPAARGRRTARRPGGRSRSRCWRSSCSPSPNFHASNFTAANGFNPYGAHGILAAVSTSGIIFSYLGFEQADQLAGESKNPRARPPDRDHRLDRASASIIYIALQVVFLARPAEQRDRQDLGRRQQQRALHGVHRAVRADRDAGRARLAGRDPLRRRHHLARPAPA